ncbi:molecular chaperone [Achromobacter sp. RTa]|uniref:fimbrial biogenesis chaperone n=1 Tax=Achromobacter sp. RTa TaxID=1532557 RepID=UPI0009DD19E1|nr:molecular chaperone [Achromobacter sp. RTa]
MSAGTARRWSALACACVLSAGAAGARADLSVDGTRFIYPAQDKSITLRTGNPGSAPILVQIWLDQGEGQDDLSRLAAPFVPMPPLFRLNPGERKAIQLRYTGEPLPQDRESQFWINFMEVPTAGERRDGLKLQINLSMKLLFRPKGLPGDPRKAPGELRWAYHPAGAVLAAENPTPYSVTLRTLRVRGAPDAGLEGVTVPPYSSARLAWPGPLPRAQELTLDYEAVDDLGLAAAGTARARAAAGS